MFLGAQHAAGEGEHSLSMYAVRQRELNRASAGLWACYARHRAKVTECVLAHAPATPGRLVVLGAGNCNDLELGKVVKAFSTVHLLDLDSVAMATGVERQGMRSAAGLRIHGGVDVTAPLDAGSLGVDGADVVVSAAMLSQLISSAMEEGQQAEGLLRVRDAHLQTMLGLLRPGGHGLLVNDMVSSDTCPQLHSTPQDRLPTLLPALLEERNFFTGCNPLAIVERLNGPLLEATGVAVSSPWRWDVGTRSHLVCAVSFRRRHESATRRPGRDVTGHS
ncbi:hypothetical protein ABIE67_010048 [Streptomyces sp. V4I8]|uniref:hypothetical protein n=1 Tax=Streptomyces sp. V4I8 TaxID=3156469 RepID=UPI0035142580